METGSDTERLHNTPRALSLPQPGLSGVLCQSGAQDSSMSCRGTGMGAKNQLNGHSSQEYAAGEEVARLWKGGTWRNLRQHHPREESDSWRAGGKRAYETFRLDSGRSCRGPAHSIATAFVQQLCARHSRSSLRPLGEENTYEALTWGLHGLADPRAFLRHTNVVESTGADRLARNPHAVLLDCYGHSLPHFL